MNAAILETTTGTNGATLKAVFAGEANSQVTHGLFRVEVDGLLGYSLIPLTDLARDLCGAWLHGGAGRAKLELHGVTRDGAAKGMRVDALRVKIDPGVLLTGGGDPFSTGQSLSDEERTVALAAVDALRDAKFAASQRKSRRARK